MHHCTSENAWSTCFCSNIALWRIVVSVEFDKIRVQSLDRYGCNDDFALSMVDEVVSKNPFEALKSISRVDVLIRFTIMEKFKQDLNLNDVCAD